jgi:hypothetical protein
MENARVSASHFWKLAAWFSLFVILHIDQRSLGFSARSQNEAFTGISDAVDQFSDVSFYLTNIYLSVHRVAAQLRDPEYHQ